jgi:hypothetical protein
MTNKKEALAALDDKLSKIQDKLEEQNNGTDIEPNILDGLMPINNLPHNGDLFPSNWKFAKRCPTAKEIANLSTVDEKDHVGMILAVQDLIKKCIIIYDVNKNKQISSGQINDSYQTFFMLEIRDFYLPGVENKISNQGICTMCNKQLEFVINSKSLIYKPISDKLLKCFDGRSFSLTFPDLETPIEFLIPTIETSSKIFNWVVKVHRKSEADILDESITKYAFDKNFLLVVPYLYVTGSETIKELTHKFKNIKENEKLFTKYIEIANNLKFDNLDTIETKCDCGSTEVNKIRFPGGWKALFINKTSNHGYY